MCNRNKFLGLIVMALGIGIIIAVLIPAWLLVWVLAIVIATVGLLIVIS